MRLLKVERKQNIINVRKETNHWGTWLSTVHENNHESYIGQAQLLIKLLKTNVKKRFGMKESFLNPWNLTHVIFSMSLFSILLKIIFIFKTRVCSEHQFQIFKILQKEF